MENGLMLKHVIALQTTVSIAKVLTYTVTIYSPCIMFSMFTGSSTVQTAKHPLYSESTTTVKSKSNSPQIVAGSHVLGVSVWSHLVLQWSVKGWLVM